MLVASVGIVAVDAAEVGRPVRGFRAHAPFDVAFPARRAGTTPLRMDQDHAGLGSGAVDRRGSRPRDDIYRLDVVGVQVIQPEWAGRERLLIRRERKARRGVGREGIFPRLNAHTVQQHEGRPVGHQALHAPQANPRPHAVHTGGRDDEEAGDPAREYVGDTAGATLPHGRRGVDDGLLLDAVWRTLARQRAPQETGDQRDIRPTAGRAHGTHTRPQGARRAVRALRPDTVAASTQQRPTGRYKE